MAIFSSHSVIKPRVLHFILLVLILLLSACNSVPVPPKGLTEAQIVALKEVGFVQTDEGWEFSQADKLLFASNVADLNPEAKQNITRIGPVLVKIQIERVRIDGHTDSEGSSDYNQQLSLRRAKAVANELISAGVSEKLVTVRGRGMSAPVASNHTYEGRAQNRRVAIVISAG